MREIKFRALDKDNKFMSDVTMINLQNGLVWTNDVHLEDGYIVEDVELMQYTGLKDKNGKEIYEGDIVEFEAIGPMSSIPDKSIGFVVFDECAFWVENNEKQIMWHLFNECREWKVMGNIYENPELLK